MGCYGQKLPTTPTLDKLANDGIRFEHAFSNQPQYSVKDPLKRGFRRDFSRFYRVSNLYDIETDPNEFNNLIHNPRYKEIRLQLRGNLIQCIKKVEGKNPVIIH